VLIDIHSLHWSKPLKQSSIYKMAYFGFPAPGDKISLGTLILPVRGIVDAKRELGVNGRRKLTRAPHIYIFLDASRNFIRLWHLTSGSWKSLELRI